MIAYRFTFFVLLLVLTSCCKEDPCEPIKISNGLYPDLGINIEGANFDGENLNISISFQGCSKDIDFDLIWDGSVAESSPIQILLLLVHNEIYDFTCTQILQKDVCFNLDNIFDSTQENTIKVRFYQNENLAVLAKK